MPHFTSPRGLATALVAFACTLTTSYAQSYAIIGAGNRENVHPRLEITTLQQNRDQWNLYLLAMSYWQGSSQNPVDSYYEVSAIHGVPFKTWDGVDGLPNAQTGYCTHSSPLFPAWHRAYMALFEQAFLKHAKAIVDAFPAGPKRNRYRKALATLRVPYWDWATGGELPTSITIDRVRVETPEGQQTILNPLMQYNFHPLDREGFRQAPWNDWDYTRRFPDSLDHDANSQQQGAIESISGAKDDLKKKVSNILTFCKTYSGFANADSAGSTPDCPTAMETIHNDIHLDMGGPNGTMTVLWYSSYDPVFWLHHANVDRLFAIWQGLNPNSYDFNASLAQGTYSMAAGTVVNADTPLQPFHKDAEGTFYTSKDVRDMKTLGYTYPEFQGDQTTVGNMRDKVKKLYGGFSSQNPVPTTRKRSMISYNEPDFSHKDNAMHPKDSTADVTEEKPVSQDITSLDNSSLQPYTPGTTGLSDPTGITEDIEPNDETLASTSSTPEHSISYNPPKTPNSHKPAFHNVPLLHASHHGKPKTPGMSTQMYSHHMPNGSSIIEYTTTIACEPYALDGSYQIIVFLGEPESENPDTWSTDKNKCGVHSSFSSPGMHMKTVNTGTVSLNNALDTHVANGILPNLTPGHVLPYLTDRLTWRAKLSGGGSIPPEEVPGLSVGLCSHKVKPAKHDDDFPVQQGGFTVHKDVTHTKPAGIKTDQQLRTNFPLPCDSCNPESVAGSNTNSYTPPYNPPADVPSDYSPQTGADVPATVASGSTPPTHDTPGQEQEPCEKPLPVPFPVTDTTPVEPELPSQPVPVPEPPIYPVGNGTTGGTPTNPGTTAPTGSAVPTVPLFTSAGSSSRQRVGGLGTLIAAVLAAASGLL